jgi:hypothetical protein
MRSLTNDLIFYKSPISWERSHNNFANFSRFCEFVRNLLLRFSQFSNRVCCASHLRLFVFNYPCE